MWQILPGLYLGDREDSRDWANLVRYRITHIVNCAGELPTVFPNELRYLNLKLRDPDPEFGSRVEEAMRFIDTGLRNGAVLVHCTAGVSRSAAVVLNYLCHRGRDFRKACIELSRAVLTGIDESFLVQIAKGQGIELPKEKLRLVSLVLAGHCIDLAEL